MATTSEVKVWNFGTEADWDFVSAEKHGTSACVLTTDVTTLDADSWDSALDVDGNGDWVPDFASTYLANPSGSPLSIADGMLVFWALRGDEGDRGKIEARIRRVDADTYQASGLSEGGAWALKEYIAPTLTTLVSDAAWEDDFPEDESTWRLCHVLFYSNNVIARIRSSEYAVGHLRELGHYHVTGTAAGNVGMAFTVASKTIRIGMGGEKDAPVAAKRVTGTATLTTDAAWTVPHGIASLQTISALCDLNGSGQTDLSVTVHWSQYTAGAWSSWRAVTPNTVIDDTQYTVTAGDKIRVKVTLDNYADPRYSPEVRGIQLRYLRTTADMAGDGAMKSVLTNLKELIDADETVIGYTGWNGTTILAPNIGEVPIYDRCGVLLVPSRSPESTEDESFNLLTTDGKKYQAKWYEHEIDVYAVMVMEEMSVETYLTQTSGLLDFAEDVKDAMRGNNLSDTIDCIIITDTDYVWEIPGVSTEDSPLLACKISVVVRSDEFSG